MKFSWGCFNQTLSLFLFLFYFIFLFFLLPSLSWFRTLSLYLWFYLLTNVSLIDQYTSCFFWPAKWKAATDITGETSTTTTFFFLLPKNCLALTYCHEHRRLLGLVIGIENLWVQKNGDGESIKKTTGVFFFFGGGHFWGYVKWTKFLTIHTDTKFTK